MSGMLTELSGTLFPPGSLIERPSLSLGLWPGGCGWLRETAGRVTQDTPQPAPSALLPEAEAGYLCTHHREHTSLRTEVNAVLLG